MTTTNRELNRALDETAKILANAKAATGLTTTNGGNNGNGNNGNGSGNGSNMTEDQLRIQFGLASIRYGNPNKNYTSEEDTRLRKEYLMWYKACEDQVRHKIMSATDLADNLKTEESVTAIMRNIQLNHIR